MKALLSAFARLIRLMSPDDLQEALRILVHRMERVGSDFVTYHLRPKRPGEGRVYAISGKSKDHKPMAIVIQGPVVHQDSFTLETVRFYRKRYPEAKLILSTWKDQAPLDAFQALGVMVCLGDKPSNNGPFNINMQIVSATNGIRAAKESGCGLVVKTRTDQRMHVEDLEGFMYGLQETFPVKDGPLKARLIASSFTTLKYRPFSISDMFMCGDVDDMLLYWDLPLDDRTQHDIAFKTVKDFTDNRIGEVYLCTEFLKKLGDLESLSLRAYWDVLRQYFCIVDYHSLDAYWPKYDRFREHRYTYYEGLHSYELLTFRDWLSVYRGYYPPEISDETMAGTPEGKYFKIQSEKV
ncbi:MAG: hypothetical protein KDD36_02260 [Flavobacteriales bacterium]|nr:hypothetical protein [Flavobacteriales bacterium]